MKFVKLLMALGTLMCFSSAAIASSDTPSQAESRSVPVLVQVNSHGKITKVTPSIKLAPALDRLMRKNLDEMISAPAVDKNGRPIASQVVINLSLDTKQDANGNYDAKFSYVSTTPVPPGNWYWVRTDGIHLALARQQSRNPRENMIINSERAPPRETPAPTPPPSNNTH